MLDAYGQALAFLMQPTILLLMTGAVIVGLVIGITPGIGGMLGMTLALPFLFHVPADIALTFLVSFHAVSPVASAGGSPRFRRFTADCRQRRARPILTGSKGHVPLLSLFRMVLGGIFSC